MSIKDLGIKHIELNFDDNELGNLNLVANDTGTRGYAINLISANGEVIKPDPSYTVQLAGVNSNYPDKTYITDAVIEDGMYVVYLSTDMVSKDGHVSLQVFVTEGNTRIIQSEIKKVKVEKSLLGGGEAGADLIVDFTKLKDAIERAEGLDKKYRENITTTEENYKSNIKQTETNYQEFVDAKNKQYNDSLDAQNKNYNTSLNEQNRKYKESLAEQEQIKEEIDTKHDNVTKIHSSLKTVFDTEEERKQAEQARKQAETSRAGSEQARKQSHQDFTRAESLRVQAEKLREQAEQARKQAEQLRQQSETERENTHDLVKEAESKRVEAEELRQRSITAFEQAEQAREQAENAREVQELERQKQERTRQTQELDRVEAEEARKEKFDGWDKTMQGVIPEATPTRLGVVKIDKAGQDTAVSPQTLEESLGKNKKYIDNLVKTPVPLNAEFTDTVVDISGKVDKVPGKGLSTNDYSNKDKLAVESMEDKTKYYWDKPEELLNIEGATRLEYGLPPISVASSKFYLTPPGGRILEIDTSGTFQGRPVIKYRDPDDIYGDTYNVATGRDLSELDDFISTDIKKIEKEVTTKIDMDLLSYTIGGVKKIGVFKVDDTGPYIEEVIVSGK